MVGTFNDEYSKTRGDGGLIKLAKAAISTELKIGHDGLNLVSGYLNKGKQEAAKKVNEVEQ